MKNLNRNILFAAIFATALVFAQCTSSEKQNTVQETAVASTESSAAIRIAYVDLDSLMSNYDFAIEINKEMMRKEEDIKMKLTEKYKTLQDDQADFERKYKNNVYATPERAQNEYNRILQQEQEIVQLEQRMTAEFEREGIAKNQELREAINKYVKKYNQDKKYDFIITKLGENLLYANPIYDVTKEVVRGLNEQYAAEKK